MNFKTHNDDDAITDKANGTCLQGYTRVKYQELVQHFGEPMPGCDKTDAEWTIEFEDGTVATIYNWKDGKNYNGRSGTPTTLITDWHIGGNSKAAVEAVCNALRQPVKAAA